MDLNAQRAFLALLDEGKSFVLTTHVQPDADGIGSEIGLASLILRRGGRVRIINADPPPRLLAELESETPIETYDPSQHDELLGQAGVIAMLDSSVVSRLGKMLAPIEASPARRVCIDHHPEPDPFWEIILLDTTSSSTGELVSGLYEAMGVPFSSWAASALYSALVSDTGRFRFRNASPGAFLTAARLVAAGARPEEIFARLEERHSEGFLRLYGEVLAALETRANGHLVLLRLPRELIERHGAVADDFSEIINRSLALASARIAALFKEREDGQTKVSLRSKGLRDVNRLARSFGGGGHPNASGIVMAAPMETTIARLMPGLLELAAS